MSYYDNTKYLSIPFVERIEDVLPQIFSQEITRFQYFSLRIECVLLFSPLTTTEDVTFKVNLHLLLSRFRWQMKQTQRFMSELT